MKTERQKQHAAYLASKEWAQIRVDLFTLRGKQCERCYRKTRLHIHHLTYINWINEEPEDLIILCNGHHNLEHGRKSIFDKKKKKRKKKKKKEFKGIKKKPHVMTKKETDMKEFINKLVAGGMNVYEAMDQYNRL